MTDSYRKSSLLTLLFGSLLGCTSYAPLPTVANADLERFMGHWFVLAHSPAFKEGDAYNAVESYELGEDGEIITTYVFRDGGFDGELVTLRPVGTVADPQTNATWNMQFYWPFSAEYLITYLEGDYSTTVIARTKRDYVWIMARSPDISEERLEELVAEVERQGYDLSKLRYVPHRWPDPGHPDSP